MHLLAATAAGNIAAAAACVYPRRLYVIRRFSCCETKKGWPPSALTADHPRSGRKPDRTTAQWGGLAVKRKSTKRHFKRFVHQESVSKRRQLIKTAAVQQTERLPFAGIESAYCSALPNCSQAFNASASGSSWQMTLSQTRTTPAARQSSSQERIHSPSPQP